jgi:hypothetical protein
MLRRFISIPSIVACAVMCGGWVCQSNADNRCPGSLTCDVDVANVCCPFDSPVWCDGCTSDASGCSSDPRTCSDLARVLECSFSAKITQAQCVGPINEPDGTNTWTVEASGSLTGCGEEVAFLLVGNEFVDASCGAWSSGVYGGCIPPEDETSTTTWSLSQTIRRAEGTPTPTEVAVVRGHGAKPVLVRADLSCAP